MITKNLVGVKQRIQLATDTATVDNLMAELMGYKYASTKTVRKCQKEASIRLAFIKAKS